MFLTDDGRIALLDLGMVGRTTAATQDQLLKLTILAAVGNAELELKVKTPDTDALLKAFQKIANRITTGLILAAMIVGASLLMQVETSFRLLGYPGIAMLFFLAAAGGGLWLVLDVLVNDRRDRRRTQH